MFWIVCILTGVVALLHLYFMILEMFLWETSYGRRVFHMSPEKAKQTSVMAKNQGLYNGFLAAGLIWAFFIPEPEFQKAVRSFFLSCVIIAGVYGAYTAKYTILFFQALPALLALLAVQMNYD